MITLDNTKELRDKIREVFNCPLYDGILKWNSDKDVHYPCLVYELESLTAQVKNPLRVATVTLLYNDNVTDKYDNEKRVKCGSDLIEVFKAKLFELSRELKIDNAFTIEKVDFKAADVIVSCSCKLKITYLENLCK